MKLTNEQREEKNQEAKNVLLRTLDDLVKDCEEDNGYVDELVVCIAVRYPDTPEGSITRTRWHSMISPAYMTTGLLDEVSLKIKSNAWTVEKDEE